MHRSRSAGGQVLVIAGLAIIVVAAIALATLGRGNTGVPPGPSPSDRPSASPSAPATPTPKPASPDPVGGLPRLDLDNATDHDVSVVVDDRTGSIAELRSGTPGDGMSVRWFDAKIEQVGTTTIRVTWVGLARDEEATLTVTARDGTVQLDFVQAAPPANSDATGYDRILIIAFDAAVDADAVKFSFNAPVPAGS